MVVYDDKILEELIVEKRNGFHILAMRKKYLYIMKQRESEERKTNTKKIRGIC